MDYPTIDQLMVAKSLASDPAFEDLNITIQPVPSLNGCPLGLYYPDTATIILPPDASEGALLHELGHRYGHYYFNDLSERYAEHFRQRYQKGRVLLYLGNDFARLPRFGSLFEEGEKGAVEIALFQPLTPDQLYEIKSQLYSHGERPKLCYGNSEVPWVRVDFIKGVDWLVIIGSVMAVSLIATVGVMGFSIYKTAKEHPWMVPFLLFGTITSSILLAAMRQEKVRERLKFPEKIW